MDNNGEKIEDFSNIHKGNRESEGIEDELKGKLKEFLDTKCNNLNQEEINKILKEIKNELDKNKLKKFLKIVTDVNLNKYDAEKLKNILTKCIDDKCIYKLDENKMAKISEAISELLTSKLKLRRFHRYLQNNDCSEGDTAIFKKINGIIREYDWEESLDIITKFWAENYNGIKGFNLNKSWINTQIHRQKIINPIFVVYINLETNELSLIKDIYNALKNPKRPLYLGESDDVVNILELELIELNKINDKKSDINSVLPGIYENSELVKIPVKLKYDINHPNDHYKICSIPKGNINKSIESFSYNGENIVFL